MSIFCFPPYNLEGGGFRNPCCWMVAVQVRCHLSYHARCRHRGRNRSWRNFRPVRWGWQRFGDPGAKICRIFRRSERKKWGGKRRVSPWEIITISGMRPCEYARMLIGSDDVVIVEHEVLWVSWAACEGGGEKTSLEILLNGTNSAFLSLIRNAGGSLRGTRFG